MTPRYVEADPFEGGKQAVAECWRNLTCVGAEPIAVTDNLNFGNPERPEIMGQFVKAIEGIGEACRALDFPVVSGNVSLYNETNGQAILPTPAIGGVGLLPDLVGDDDHRLQGGRRCDPPDRRPWHSSRPVDLSARNPGPRGRRAAAGRSRSRSRHGDFIRGLIRAGEVTAVHDISDGGLAQCLVEMALASGDLGAEIALDSRAPHIALFAEDQARYVVTCPPDKAKALVESAWDAGIAAEQIGEVTAVGGLAIWPGASISQEELRNAHEGWFPEYMSGTASNA